MLIVTGASGELGRRIVGELLQLVPAELIGVSVRDASRVADLAKLGVRVREASFDDPQSLRQAWEGARRVLLVSSNAAATGGDSLKQHATAIAVACELAVERVLYTSQVSCSPASWFPPGRDHAATEKMLAESGLAWTSMRHGFYAASALKMNRAGFEAGVIAAPQDGKVAWTAHDDLARADALLLAGKITIDGATPPLTGSEALDLGDLAAIAGDLSGKTVRRIVASESDLETNARRAGVPEGSIAVMLGYYRAAREGEFETVDPTLANMLGRKPLTMRDLMLAEAG